MSDDKIFVRIIMVKKIKRTKTIRFQAVFNVIPLFTPYTHDQYTRSDFIAVNQILMGPPL